MNTLKYPIAFLASASLGLSNFLSAATVTSPYYNDFTSSAADFTTSGVGSWSLVDTNSDTNPDAYQLSATTSSSAAFSMLTLGGNPGSSFTDFTVSTTFSVSSVASVGEPYWGMAILGSSESTPGSYILIDYQGDNGQFRIINVGGPGTGSAVSTSKFGGAFALDTPITLTVNGTYVGSMLTLTADFDDGTPIQTITASAFDASSHYTGSAMGLRVRTPSGGGTVVNFDSFAASVIPEPGTYAMIAGAFVLLGAVLIRRK